MIFSPEELKEVERDCAIYVGRMERVAHHSSISKEEKVLGAVGLGAFRAPPSPLRVLGQWGGCPDVLCPVGYLGGGRLGRALSSLLWDWLGGRHAQSWAAGPEVPALGDPCELLSCSEGAGVPGPVL